MKNYVVTQLDEIGPVDCPCGQTRRGFLGPDNQAATMHLVEISEDSRVHFHKELTEIYLVLEGDGQLELDGDIVQAKPMSAILIKPGCRHRAVGRLRVIVVAIPAFDPQDEWFDE